MISSPPVSLPLLSLTLLSFSPSLSLSLSLSYRYFPLLFSICIYYLLFLKDFGTKLDCVWKLHITVYVHVHVYIEMCYNNYYTYI